MNSSQKLEVFFTSLRTAQRGLLMLDYDGTIAPFRAERMAAIPAPGFREALDAILEQKKTRLVFVSGRQTQEVATLAGLAHPVEVWGCHGREHRDPDGTTTIHGVSAAQQQLLSGEHDRLMGEGISAERVELKTGCLAFHWRGIPAAEAKRLVAILSGRWNEIAGREGILFLHFDGGIELAIPGRSKGDSVALLLAQHEHEHGKIGAAFLGDDITDEDGFRALGSRGLSVLARNEPRETAADVRVSMPGGVLEFLRSWHCALA